MTLGAESPACPYCIYTSTRVYIKWAYVCSVQCPLDTRLLEVQVIRHRTLEGKCLESETCPLNTRNEIASEIPEERLGDHGLRETPSKLIDYLIGSPGCLQRRAHTGNTGSTFDHARTEHGWAHAKR